MRRFPTTKPAYWRWKVISGMYRGPCFCASLARAAGNRISSSRMSCFVGVHVPRTFCGVPRLHRCNKPLAADVESTAPPAGSSAADVTANALVEIRSAQQTAASRMLLFIMVRNQPVENAYSPAHAPAGGQRLLFPVLPGDAGDIEMCPRRLVDKPLEKLRRHD